jgi:hypothetical protein
MALYQKSDYYEQTTLNVEMVRLVNTEFSSIKAKTERLAQIAEDLRTGKSFSVTRLTTIKSLCADRTACQEFALHIANLAKRKMDIRDKPDYINQKQWLRFRQAVENALIALEHAHEQGIEKNRSRLQGLLQELKSLQNTYENQEWGPVRIILSSETLVVEYAVECFLSTSQAPYWAYLLARTYAEQYDSRFGNGLVPKSAPMVEDIARFWRNRYLNQADNE